MPDDPASARRIKRTDPGGLTQQLVRKLTESIRSGELHPGDRLPTESELVTSYGVSRTVVREAMSRLSAQGFVEIQQGRGSFVLAGPSTISFSLDPGRMRSADDVGELLEFRIGFETEAAGLASVRADSARIAGIRVRLERFIGEVENPGRSVKTDFEFHRSVAVASGNRYLLQILDSLGPTAIATPRARLVDGTEDDQVAHHRIVAIEHTNIYDAIARHSPEDARAAMRVHLSNSKHRLTGIRPNGIGNTPDDH